MSKIYEDGGPAFPQPNHIVETDVGRQEARLWLENTGMSLRDWFAGMALQQFVAQRDHNMWAHEKFSEARNEIAVAAYGIADAMIAEREKGKQNAETNPTS